MPPQNTGAALLIAFEMICPVYFVKWKLVIVMETMCTSSMYFEFHFVSCKIEATDCNRGKVHLSLYFVFHFVKWRLLIVEKFDLSLWNQDLVFSRSWTLWKLNNPGHITCRFFLTFRINIFNELSIATDIDDLHFEIKLSD